MNTLKQHWPEYLMESVLLGLFMISAEVFTVLFEYPNSPIHQAIARGIQIDAFPGATPVYLLSNSARVIPAHEWYYNFDLAAERDRIYHQGTVWGWLLGSFALAHMRVYKNPAQAQKLLEPMANHLTTHGLGNLSEIFDGDAPMTARGCIAQAWTVAEVLRTWPAIEDL